MTDHTTSMTLALLTLWLSPLTASADPPTGALREVPLFLITKSENANRVVYTVRLDERCGPVSDAPVRPFWRMLEKGPTATEPLLAHEQPAYGVHQSVQGDVVRMTLNALPRRDLVVTSWRSGGTCNAAAWGTVDGQPARLLDVHAVLAGPFGIDHLVVRGRTRDGRVVKETVTR